MTFKSTFPELSEGQRAMLLRLLMEVAPEWVRTEAEMAVVQSYQRNIRELLEGE